MSPKISPPPPPPSLPVDPSLYAHSPLHHAVITRSHSTLIRLLSTLPPSPPPPPSSSLSSSLAAELSASALSYLLDPRGPHIPLNLSPLHLAVLTNDLLSVTLLSSAGADPTLQNSLGWSPLHDALSLRRTDIASVLIKQHHRDSYLKWRRRLPRVVHGLRLMRDFYMEIGFRFESSVVPLIGKIAPSDTYRIWKKDGNLRVDMTLAGFDGLRIQRSDQSFLFLGDGKGDVAAIGSLLVLNHEERRVYDAFENAGAEMSEKEVAALVNQTSVYRPGMDVTKAELVKCMNWRGKERTESVGEWKSKVYEIQNVSFSFKSRKPCNAESESAGAEQVLPLELDEEAEEGYLVADLGAGAAEGRRHSSFVKSEREWVTVSRKSVDINLGSDRRRMLPERVMMVKETMPAVKEKEWVRNLKPMVWLTEDFPLKTEELLPLLDILADKVKAVRRMRELLTTKFPPGTFPVKISIPVIPTVKVVITFSKFVELPPTDLFYTPCSSPRHLNNGQGESSESNYKSCSSFSSSSSSSTSWLWRSSSRRITEKQQQQQQQQSSKGSSESDPFEIPSGYTWTSIDSLTNDKLKRSKSVRKSK